MRTGVLVTCLVAAALAPARARAQDAGAIVLEPTSSWNASHEDGKCRLSRMFGAAGQQHALVFEQAAPDARFHMSVAGPSLADITAGRKLRLAFGPGRSESEQEIVKQRNAEFGTVVFLKDISLDPDAVAAAEASVGIGLAVSTSGIDTEAARPLREITLAQEGRTLVFRIGPLAAPFGVLNDCTSHILSTWGIDAEAHRTARRSTRLLEVQKVARGIQEKYPLQAVMQSRGGVVGVAILVDAQGTPTECRITSDSGDGSLNAVACEGLMKARFDPALDVEGKPMKSYWMTRITYRIGI
jgi:TonB family protein